MLRERVGVEAWFGESSCSDERQARFKGRGLEESADMDVGSGRQAGTRRCATGRSQVTQTVTECNAP